MAPEQLETAERVHRTNDQRVMVERGVDIMRSIVLSMRAEASAVGIMPRTQLADSGEPVDVSTLIEAFREEQRRVEVCQAMTTFLEGMGSAPLIENGEYVVPDIPLMTPETIKPFLREPILENESACVANTQCYVNKVANWPEGTKLRAMTPGGYCALCHDFLVYKMVVDQTSKHARWRLVPDPNKEELTYAWGSPASINAVQYSFGPGGFKRDLRLIDVDVAPIPGIIGCAIIPSIGHYSPYTYDEHWYLDDTERHFAQTAV